MGCGWNCKRLSITLLPVTGNKRWIIFFFHFLSLISPLLTMYICPPFSTENRGGGARHYSFYSILMCQDHKRTNEAYCIVYIWLNVSLLRYYCTGGGGHRKEKMMVMNHNDELLPSCRHHASRVVSRIMV